MQNTEYKIQNADAMFNSYLIFFSLAESLLDLGGWTGLLPSHTYTSLVPSPPTVSITVSKPFTTHQPLIKGN